MLFYPLAKQIHDRKTINHFIHHLVRAKGKPIKDVSCNGKKFTRAQIVAAKAAATTRHGKYPERYGNRERLFASAKPLFEFPLTDVPYTSKCLCFLCLFTLKNGEREREK